MTKLAISHIYFVFFDKREQLKFGFDGLRRKGNITMTQNKKNCG